MTAGLKNPSALYNAACAFARSGQAEKALDALGKSVAASAPAANGLRADPDLETLRKSARFEALAVQVDSAVHPCRGDPLK